VYGLAQPPYVCLYNREVAFEWDADKNERNIRKHGIHFADAAATLEDEFASTVGDDSDPDEERFVSLGLDGLLRLLVVVYTYRGDNVRIISARLAEPRERESYEAQL
jgi:uncharacterized DUF497 family protein